MYQDMHFVSRVVKFLQLLEIVRKFNGKQKVVTRICFWHYM